MTSRGRFNKAPQDWDPMQEDYNDTMYDPQYADGDIKGGVQLDHYKLYVTNINKALNEEGLRAAFAKYANNVRIYLSKDPEKRYAIVTFDTPGEARHAMMKLNKTEPLRLVVSIAHKKKYTHGNNQANNRDDSASGSSRGWSSRKQEQEDQSQDLSVDDADLGLDQDLNEMDLELQLKYHYHQAQIIKCQQLLGQRTGKKLSSQRPSNRSILPDGRIVVRNTERQSLTDNVFSSAAGDSHDRLQKCIWCNFPADLYCSRCKITPYCGVRCQEADWLTRHQATCHNLFFARDVIPDAKVKEFEIKKESNPPELKKGSNPRTREHEPKIKEPEPNISEPPIGLMKPVPSRGAIRCTRSPANKNRDDNSDRTRKNVHSAGQKANRNSNFKNYNNIRRPNAPVNKNQEDEEDFFSVKAEKKPAEEEKPFQEDKTPQPLRRPAQAPSKPPVPDNVTDKVETKPAAPTPAALKVVPKSYLVDTLSAGDTGILTVESDAASCKGKSGFICVTLHENSGEDYEKLCNDYLDDCEKDDSYTPQPGELFSFKNPEDNSWYRARCLNKSLAALIDLGKLADLSAGSECKKITPKYENIPEFCCELDAKGIKIADNLKYTIISKSGSACKVSLENNETIAVICEGEIRRWEPTVDIPTSTLAPQETKPAEKKPAEEEKPFQEDNTPQPLRRPAQAPSKHPVPDNVTAKVEPKPAAAPKVVPKSYLVDTLSAGDTGILSVESDAASCKGKSGFICVTLHENSGEDYEKLCNDYLDDCEKNESLTPQPGELFSFKNPEDNSWYRARCLNKSLAALIDLGKLADLSAGSECKKITPKYENIPEFCCELDAKGIKISDNLKYTIISKSGSTCKVSLENNETNAVICEGEIRRWEPTVEIPTSTLVIPEVQRPDLKDNSRVLLVDCRSWKDTFIRPADIQSRKKFDMILNDTLESGKNATPIKEPPKKGQTVIAKYTDGLWYRALVKRTNESQNKYQLEYAEYGNIRISQRENIVACPQELTLDHQPTVVSKGNLKVATSLSFTEAASEYLQNIQDNETELILTLTDGSKAPAGAKQAPSGADIKLTVAKNNELMNKKLEELCTPEWKKFEVNGGDVIDTPRLMYSDLRYATLPSSECELMVLDTTFLNEGVISGCQLLPGTEQWFEKLEQKLSEYCNSDLGKEPYLPSAQELCVAQCPPYEQWYRAVVVEQVDGPGGSTLQLCYIDYGNVAFVPVTAVRKMLPEFLEGIPAVALTIEIQGFPKYPPEDIILKALRHMKLMEKTRGTLRVVRCDMQKSGGYIVDAPELLEAIKC